MGPQQLAPAYPQTACAQIATMSIFKPEYETYQDVKNTLAYWGTPVWFTVIAAFWYVVLLASHRRVIAHCLTEANWVTEPVTVTVIFVAAVAISQFMVHILEAHDKIYDRYVIKWRDRYARRQMIPELLQPYRAELPDPFLQWAEQNPRETLKTLFYRFAADRDARIGHNLIVRFYERVTKYWLTQIIEMAVLLFAGATLLYGLPCYGRQPPVSVLLVILAAGVVFVVNRLWSGALRKTIWEATRDEIAAIHSSCSDDFEDALKALCNEHGFDFKETAH